MGGAGGHSLLAPSLNKKAKSKGPNIQNSVPMKKPQADISYLGELWRGRKVRVGISILTRPFLHLRKLKTWRQVWQEGKWKRNNIYCVHTMGQVLGQALYAGHLS